MKTSPGKAAAIEAQTARIQTKRSRHRPFEGREGVLTLFRAGSTLEGICDRMRIDRDTAERYLRAELRSRTWRCRYCDGGK